MGQHRRDDGSVFALILGVMIALFILVCMCAPIFI